MRDITKKEIDGELKDIKAADRQDYLMKALLLEMRLLNKTTDKMKEEGERKQKEHIAKVRQSINDMDPAIRKLVGPFLGGI